VAVDLAHAPFRHLRGVVTTAGAYLIATVVWVLAGDVLPGGRWFAVHLFTVGVLSNLVTALTHHFSRTLLHVAGPERDVPRLVLLNVGALVLLCGRAYDLTWAVGLGATVLMGAVVWLYTDLRRERRQSLGTRFAYVIRVYERACGAFVHGAMLGALLGIGVLGGAWFGAARLAHLHVNVLGWGGLTLLGTLVFFGPSILRVRMAEGAAEAAPRALRWSASGLTVGALALLATGWSGGPQTLFRLLAAAGLAVYAWGAAVVCIGVLRAGMKAKPTAHAHLIRAACAWFVIAAVTDAVIVAGGWWWLLDAVGAALLVGVLGQAILGALNYLAPMVLVAGTKTRTAARDDLDVAALWRALVLNAGALAIVAAVVLRHVGAPAWLGAVGWVAIGATVLAQVALLGWVRVRYPQEQVRDASAAG
jgi:hypothetical protein